MTNEEKDLLIAYLIDTGDIDPDGDVAGQFLDWYQVREGVGSGETHYKAVLEAARVRARSFEEGRMSGLAEGAAKLGWDELEIARGLQGLWITSVRGRLTPGPFFEEVPSAMVWRRFLSLWKSHVLYGPTEP